MSTKALRWSCYVCSGVPMITDPTVQWSTVITDPNCSLMSMKALRWSRWISQACTTVMFRRDKNTWRPHAIVRIGWEAGPLKNTATHHLTITLHLLTLWEIGWSIYGLSWTHGYICSCCYLWTATYSGLAKCSLIYLHLKKSKKSEPQSFYTVSVWKTTTCIS